MAGSTLPSSGSSRPPRGRSRTKFLLFSTVILLGLGFVGGVYATKVAMKSPLWVQHVFGFEMPSVAQATPTPSLPLPPVAPVAPVPPTTPPPAPTPPITDSHAAANTPDHSKVNHSGPPSPADEQGFLGHWEITDEVKGGDGAPTQVQSVYVFNADGTGEFDTNGKKMYGLRWILAGDFLTLTYDNEESPQGDDGAIRMRWSVSPDKTLLTLVPDNGKDARPTLYSVGAGVYHKK
ncbi:MAG: hypothetical protein JWN14_2847 [Chthonomonadales bacterium]|nr:hypothetical protein [Chthonomonadales bacterium]